MVMGFLVKTEENKQRKHLAEKPNGYVRGKIIINPFPYTN